MEIKAAVLYEANTPLVVEPVQLDDPKAGEVLVRVAASGVCHSDYHVMKGEWTPPLPMVLGHEAAGVVERVGAGVGRVRPGDHVILNFRPNRGWCAHCSRGEPVLCNGADSERRLLFDGSTRPAALPGAGARRRTRGAGGPVRGSASAHGGQMSRMSGTAITVITASRGSPSRQ